MNEGQQPFEPPKPGKVRLFIDSAKARYRNSNLKQWQKIAIFVVLFGIVGSVLLYSSFAAEPQFSIDPGKPLAPQTKALTFAVRSQANKARFAPAAEQATEHRKLADVLTARNKAMQFAIAHDPAYALDNALSADEIAALPKNLQDKVEKIVSVEGTWGSMHAEYSPALTASAEAKKLAPISHNQSHFIKTADGQQLFLHSPAKFDNLRDGQKVKVNGIQLSNTIAISSQVEKTAAAPETTDEVVDIVESKDTVTPQTQSNMNIANFMMNFANDTHVDTNPETGKPWSQADLKDVYFTGPESLKKLYEESSDGRMTVTGAVYNWITMPSNITNQVECYLDSDGYYQPVYDIFAYKQAMMAAARIWLLQHGYNLAQYTNIAWTFNRFLPTGTNVTQDNCMLDGYAFSNGIPATEIYNDLNFYLMAKRPHGDMLEHNWMISLAPHEFGHNLGLYHSYGDCVNPSDPDEINHTCMGWSEYGNVYSSMGYGGFKSSSSEFDVYQKLRLGWITPGQVKLLKQSGEITIDVVEKLLGLGRYYAALAPSKVPGQAIIAEFRNNTSSVFDIYNSPSILDHFSTSSGVIVTRAPDRYRAAWGDGTPQDYSSILLNRHTFTPPDPDSPWLTYQLNDAALQDGQIFTDARSDVCVHVLSHTATTAKLRLTVGCSQPFGVGIGLNDAKTGYWIARPNGEVHPYGSAPFQGSVGSAPLNMPIIGMAPSHYSDGKDGYWLLGKDGGVFAYGAGAYGSAAGKLSAGHYATGIAPTRDSNGNNRGYWVVDNHGSIYAFGNATYQYGLSNCDKAPTNNHCPNGPIIVSNIADITGFSNSGYTMLASDGSTYTLGTARSRGSARGLILPGHAARGISRTSSGAGYWIVDNTGNMYAFGDAGGLPSLSQLGIKVTNIVGLSCQGDKPHNNFGCVLLGSDGAVYALGRSNYYGRFEK